MVYEGRGGRLEDFEVFRQELDTKVHHPKIKPWRDLLLREWASFRSRRNREDRDMIIVFVLGKISLLADSQLLANYYRRPRRGQGDTVR